MKKWYSIRMRASSGASHENGGQHISGAEKLVTKTNIETSAIEMIRRATNHTRGDADFISLKMEHIPEETIQYALPLHRMEAENTHEHTTKASLWEQVKYFPIRKQLLFSLYDWILQDDITRGAIVVDIHTGKRLDPYATRGVRVSRVDWDAFYKKKWLMENHCPEPERATEAMALATKVAQAGTICEICCSDDPEYTTGYITFQHTYIRIPNMKEKGSICGGRVFLVDANKIDLHAYIHYLEKVPVLIGEEKK